MRFELQTTAVELDDVFELPRAHEEHYQIQIFIYQIQIFIEYTNSITSLHYNLTSGTRKND